MNFKDLVPMIEEELKTTVQFDAYTLGMKDFEFEELMQREFESAAREIMKNWKRLKSTKGINVPRH